MIENKKFDLLKFMEYIMAIIILLDCNSAYTRIVNENFYIKEISVIFSLLFLICILIYFKKINRKKILKGIAIILPFVIFLLFKVRISVFMYIIKYLVFLPTLLLLMQKENKYIDFLKVITNVTFVMAIVSLFFYVFGSILHIIPNSSIYINWGGINLQKNYLFLHFDTQIETIFGLNITRNSGIYTEAPMYSCILLFSLIMELFLNCKNKKHIIIFMITICSTLSLVGICLSMVLIILEFLSTKNVKFIYKFITFPILLIVAVFSINYLVSNKVENNQNSYSARMDDYKASYEAWKDNPIMGAGYEDTSATVNHMQARRRNNPGQSNAIGRYFSEGGIYFALLVFAPYILLGIKGELQKKYNYFIFSIGMIFSLCTINVPYQMFTIVMLSICYRCLFNKEKLEEKNEI